MWDCGVRTVFKVFRENARTCLLPESQNVQKLPRRTVQEKDGRVDKKYDDGERYELEKRDAN